MFRITFKNVGQGDSIILESESDIAIIDCNLYEGSNPVLDYIRKGTWKSIKFILLTHPHTDHFSGLLDILIYCDNNKIKVDNFYYTGQISPKFIKDAVYGVDSQNQLAQIFAKMNQLALKGIILDANPISATLTINLNDKFIIKVLAPHITDVVNFVTKEHKIDNGMLNNNSEANALSTILKIETSDNYLLLTSDAPKLSFRRMVNSFVDFKSKKLVLGQVSHHGSLGSYLETFWEDTGRNIDSFAAISAGNGYRHPSLNVVSHLAKNNYQIKYTNLVGGLIEYYNVADVSKKSLLLNQFSKIVSNNSTSQDLVFEFNENLEIIYTRPF